MFDAQRSLALLAMRNGNMDTLLQTATQMIKLQPASPDGYALRAVSEINRRQFASAEADARMAIQVSPQSQLGFVQLGNLKYIQKQYPEATQAYREALGRDPNSNDALRGLMNTYLIQNRAEEALAAVNLQITKDPNNSGFYDLLGTVLLRNKKDLNAAETALRRAAELDKDNTDAVIKLGQAQAQNGGADRALATYLQAIRDHPSVPDFYLLLGQLYESKQDPSRALDAYRKALELRPGDPLASKNLANVLLQNGGSLDEALTLAQTARHGMPNSSSAADTLAWVFYQKGSYRSAASLLQEALKLQSKNNESDSPDIHYHLGMAYQKLEQPALARQQLERVLKIDPNYGEAAQVRRQLGSLKS